MALPVDVGGELGVDGGIRVLVEVGFMLGLVEGVTDTEGVGVSDGASPTTAKPWGWSGTEPPTPSATSLPERSYELHVVPGGPFWSTVSERAILVVLCSNTVSWPPPLRTSRDTTGISSTASSFAGIPSPVATADNSVAPAGNIPSSVTGTREPGVSVTP